MKSSNFISVPKEFKGVSKAGIRKSSTETAALSSACRERPPVTRLRARQGM